MAESPESDRRNPPSAPSPDVAAWAALSAADRDNANAFLEQHRKVAVEQEVLVRLQAKEFAHELALRHWSLRVRHVSDALKLSFELGAALLILAIVSGVAAALWAAAHDNSLVIDASSVPLDMAQRGLTGEVVANKLLDRLSSLQAQTASRRASSSYANDWDNDIKVQIPDTGISIGEFDRYLRKWLGHETHITSEIYRTASGTTVTVRMGDTGSATFTGREGDLDNLIGQAAEAAYRNTQPYRYTFFLFNHGRVAQSEALFRVLTVTGSTTDRAWSWTALAIIQGDRADVRAGMQSDRAALAINPDMSTAYEGLSEFEGFLQHDEQQLAAARKSIAIAGRESDLSEEGRAIIKLEFRQAIAQLQGDWEEVLRADRAMQSLVRFGFVESAFETDIIASAMMHDGNAMRAAIDSLPPSNDPDTLQSRTSNIEVAEVALEDWHAALKAHAAAELALKHSPWALINEERVERPIAGLELAMTGERKGAHAAIDGTPLDCVQCLRWRGTIDASEKNWRGADYWFARAANNAPSIPSVFTDWGAMLLAKGDYDSAIEKFREANRKGPHFADPLEMWGEALIAKSRSDLAIAKFEDANKNAPNWGRLHLEWGEALTYVGRAGEAEGQFALASHLDLSSTDRTRLSQLLGTRR